MSIERLRPTPESLPLTSNQQQLLKESLIEAANEANIPPGPERSALLGRVVSVFIEELYGFRTGNRVSGDWSNEGRI